MERRYIKQWGMEVSPLGFGIMRLPVEGDTFSAEVYELIDGAMGEGIDYYDTAYPYLQGKSEVLVREALVKRYERDSFYIADKLPVWECRDRDDMDRIFQIQMQRLGVDHIDFYLLHGLHKSRWEDIYDKGVLDFLEEKKKEGKVRKVGFSFHDTPDVLMQIEEKYKWDLIQLQINYYDWEMIGAKECYEYLVQKDIPCTVMEPVGGGRLSRLPNRAECIFRKLDPDRSIASWAMGYVASLPNVAVTLSGMNDKEQLKDNVEQFSDIRPLTDDEGQAIKQVVDIVRSYSAIPCSGCRYCVDVCPKGIDIPQIFRRYNDSCMFDDITKFDIDYYAFVPEGKRGDSCIHCNSCSNRCPQKIDIPQEIEKIHNIAVSLSLGMEESGWGYFLQYCKGKKIICFGAGQRGKHAKQILQGEGYEVAYFCDNDKDKWGTFADGIEVIGPDKLRDIYTSERFTILITSVYHEDIRVQLKNLGVRFI